MPAGPGYHIAVYGGPACYNDRVSCRLAANARGVGAHLKQRTMHGMSSYEMPGTTDLTSLEGETLTHLVGSIVALSRRWTSAGIKGKGIRLADHELDLLNAIGAGEMLMSAAAEGQKKQAVERRALKARKASIDT